MKEKLPDEFHVHHPSTRRTSRLRSCHLGIFGRETLFFIVIYELEISFLHFIPIYLSRCVCVCVCGCAPAIPDEKKNLPRPISQENLWIKQVFFYI